MIQRHHTLSRLTALGDEQARAELRAYESLQPNISRINGFRDYLDIARRVEREAREREFWRAK